MNEIPSERDGLVGLIDHLSDVLSEETALLESLDLRKAGELLGCKRDAVISLQRALSTASKPLQPELQDVDHLRASVHRLCTFAEANRVAIERGLATQLQVVQAIAQAVPKARAGHAPTYQPDGSKVPPRPPEAYAFLSRM